jgi:hypothetical protein
MSRLYLRLATVLGGAALICLSSLLVLSLAHAAPGDLVRKPYLQQMSDTGVIILWATQTGLNAEVHYSTDTSYSTVVTGSSRSVNGNQLHRVALTNLQSDTVYYYKVYVDGEDLLSGEVLSFQTAPVPGSSTPFAFVVMGDYGRNSTSQKALRDQLLLDSFRFILTTGDNAYSSGTYAEFDTNVFQIYQDLFSHVGFFPSLGNHDYGTASGASYLDLFDLPQQSWRSNDHERYYSFDYGNVHFVVLDSNSPLDADDDAAGDDMFDWLRADLSHTRQPWRMVAFHHPAYSTGLHGSDSRVQAKLVPIFETYGVDLVLTGHDHIYQRSRPLREDQITTINQGGIVYLVLGAGSAADYGCSSAAWVEIAYCAQSEGLYARLTISGTHLTVAAIDALGDTKDFYELDKTVDVPLQTVQISGPTVWLTGTTSTFTAIVAPVTATLPVTYVWRATVQSPVTGTAGLQHTASFTWPTTGTQTITVTATNIWTTTVITYTIDILAVGAKTYLPLIIRE